MSSRSVWETLKQEADDAIKAEPLLASYIYSCVLNHSSFEASLSFILSNKIDTVPADGLGRLSYVEK